MGTEANREATEFLLLGTDDCVKEWTTGAEGRIDLVGSFEVVEQPVMNVL